MIIALGLAITTRMLHAELPGYLTNSFATERWIAYSSTGNSPMPDSEETIRLDLETLHRAGFLGIVTYGCDGLKKQIPKIARSVGISHIVLGIYNPNNREEIENAKELATMVDAYCIGNESILEKSPRYNITELKAAMDEIRQWTGRPVTTSEQIDKYYDPQVGDQLLDLGDWLFPNVHPYWHRITTQPEAAEWTQEQFQKLSALAKGKPIMFKEVGLPTGSEDIEDKSANQQTQADYYLSLRALHVPFVYFEAFDQVWKKNPPIEPFWGVFDKDRKPKLVVSQLGQLVPGVQILSVKSEGKLPVRLAPVGGFFYISGTVSGLDDDRELIMFVNTGDPDAPGWFFQMSPNGIGDIDGEKWSAQGQIGNAKSPPRQGQKIHIRILAASKQDAKRLRDERINNDELQNTGLLSQDLPQVDPQWRADLRDMELDIPPSGP